MCCVKQQVGMTFRLKSECRIIICLHNFILHMFQHIPVILILILHLWDINVEKYVTYVYEVPTNDCIASAIFLELYHLSYDYMQSSSESMSISILVPVN